MAKKDHYLIVDVETTVKDTVADFGAVICDRKGEVLHQCAVLVKDIFGITPLFYLAREPSKAIWSKQGKDRRFTAYENMLDSGARMLASVNAINRWLDNAKNQYQPILTAYNLPFDIDKCHKTQIDLNPFDQRFCLWRAAYAKWGHTKQYRQFILDAHAFNPPTELGNMSYKTNANIMAKFLMNNQGLDDEPHTALEDILYYELPILRRLLKKTSKEKLLDPRLSFAWQDVQVRDWFTPK